MRRRQVLRGSVVGLGAVLAGCSAAADQSADRTNDLILVNVMEVPAVFELAATGPTNRKITYEVEPGTARQVTDYVTDGSYQLEASIEFEVEAEDGGTETVTKTTTGAWNPEACHTCKLRARSRDVEIELEDCTTETPSPTPTPTAANGTAGTTGTATGTGDDG